LPVWFRLTRSRLSKNTATPVTISCCVEPRTQPSPHGAWGSRWGVTTRAVRSGPPAWRCRDAQYAA